MFNLSKLIRKTPVVHEIAYNFAKSYVNNYVGFNSDTNINGEKWLIQHLAQLFRDKKFVFVDGGANVGNWTKIILNSFSSYEGHLFELMPTTFELLQKNLKDNPNLHLNNLGLGSRPETLYAKNFGAGHTCNTLVTELVNSRIQEPQQQVQVINLDSYCEKAGITQIDFLKLDVEGYEFPAISGAINLLKDQKIKIVQFEYSSGNLERKEIIRDFYNLLKPLGYKVGPLRPDGVLFQEYHSELNCSRSGPNFIACLPEYELALLKKPAVHK